MAGWVEDLVTQDGTIAVFAGTALEGETVAITGGLLAHRRGSSMTCCWSSRSPFRGRRLLCPATEIRRRMEEDAKG